MFLINGIVIVSLNSRIIATTVNNSRLLELLE